jgi:hypothetical protein
VSERDKKKYDVDIAIQSVRIKLYWNISNVTSTDLILESGFKVRLDDVTPRCVVNVYVADTTQSPMLRIQISLLK